MTEADYLSVAEAARLLGLSELTIYRRVWDGSVPVLRLSEGGAIRIPRHALEAGAQRIGAGGMSRGHLIAGGKRVGTIPLPPGTRDATLPRPQVPADVARFDERPDGLAIDTSLRPTAASVGVSGASSDA